jgi:hypothetical protein
VPHGHAPARGRVDIGEGGRGTATDVDLRACSRKNAEMFMVISPPSLVLLLQCDHVLVLLVELSE